MAKSKSPKSTSATLGFEQQIWDAACELWGHIPAADYRKIFTGLIFLKYISTAFEKKYNELVAEGDGFEDDTDAYEAENILFVPPEARWSEIASNDNDKCLEKFESGNLHSNVIINFVILYRLLQKEFFLLTEYTKEIDKLQNSKQIIKIENFNSVTKTVTEQIYVYENEILISIRDTLLPKLMNEEIEV